MKMKGNLLLAAISCVGASAMAALPAPAADGSGPGGASSPLAVTGEIQRQMERDRLQFQQQQLDTQRLGTQFDLRLNRSLQGVDPTASANERALEDRLQNLDIQQRNLTDRLWRLNQPPAAPAPRRPAVQRDAVPGSAAPPLLRPGQGDTPMPGSDAASEEARRYVDALLRSSQARQRSR